MVIYTVDYLLPQWVNGKGLKQGWEVQAKKDLKKCPQLTIKWLECVEVEGGKGETGEEILDRIENIVTDCEDLLASSVPAPNVPII